jgi:hypothetical protein
MTTTTQSGSTVVRWLQDGSALVHSPQTREVYLVENPQIRIVPKVIHKLGRKIRVLVKFLVGEGQGTKNSPARRMLRVVLEVLHPGRIARAIGDFVNTILPKIEAVFGVRFHPFGFVMGVRVGAA